MAIGNLNSFFVLCYGSRVVGFRPFIANKGFVVFYFTFMFILNYKSACLPTPQRDCRSLKRSNKHAEKVILALKVIITVPYPTPYM